MHHLPVAGAAVLGGQIVLGMAQKGVECTNTLSERIFCAVAPLERGG
jgi:hypothetical protein